MSPEKRFSRRQVIQSAIGAAPLTAAASAHGASAERLPWEFCTFTKPLQELSFDECSRIVAAAGYQGVEAPVRPKGQVLPERVEEDLPKLMHALAKHELKMTILTSRINEVSKEQYTETLLRTAAKQGIKRFRMGYYYYDLNQPIRPQIADFRARLKDLVALTDELGIKPIYQNHSGKKYFGAPIWDLYEVLSDYQPDQVGVAFDIGHAFVEGAKAWPLNFSLIRPYIDTIYIKEPHWHNNQLDWGPIGEGALDKGFFEILKRDKKFVGPISVHVEYLKRDVPRVIPALKSNLDSVHKLLR